MTNSDETQVPDSQVPNSPDSQMSDFDLAAGFSQPLNFADFGDFADDEDLDKWMDAFEEDELPARAEWPVDFEGKIRKALSITDDDPKRRAAVGIFWYDETLLVDLGALSSTLKTTVSWLQRRFRLYRFKTLSTRGCSKEFWNELLGAEGGRAPPKRQWRAYVHMDGLFTPAGVKGSARVLRRGTVKSCNRMKRLAGTARQRQADASEEKNEEA